MRTVFVLFDSLNRLALGAYGGEAIATPNFDRFAKKAVTFDKHYVGSLPCMPARRDMHTGRLNFMHRHWGPLEPFDDSSARILSQNGVYSHLISSRNATVGGTLVPTLALGIPGDGSSAMLLAAVLILGFVPGPILFEQQPAIVGGIFLVYLASNVFLLFAVILMTPLFVYILRIPKYYLIPVVLLLCSIGTFAIQASVFDLKVMFGFGLTGILFRAANYPLSPIVIGLILGPILENNLRRALLISREGYWIFLDRPVSATLVAINVILIIGALIVAVRARQKKRRAALEE